MLARKSALIVLMNLVGAVGGWLSLKFIALYVGPDPLGSLGFALAIVGFFEIVGDLGFNTAYVKRVSEGQDLGAAIATFRLVKLALVSAMVLGVSASLFVWTILLGRPFVTTNVAVIYLVLGYAVIKAFITIPTLVFDARLETAKTQVAILAEHVVRVPATIVVALLVGAAAGIGPLASPPPALVDLARRRPAELLAAAYVLGSAATLVVALWLGRHYHGTRPSRAFVGTMWRFALPTFLVAVSGALASQIDRFMIGFLYDREEVGLYFAAQRTTALLQIVPVAVAGLLFPAVSERHAALDRKSVLELTVQAERYSTLLVAPAIVLFLFLPTPIVRVLLSDAFLPAAPALFLLTIVALLVGLFQLHVSLLAGIDRPGVQARASLVAFGLNVALNLLLIPDHGLVLFVPIRGAVGAALATLFAFLAALAYLMVHSWRLAGKGPSRHIAKQLAVAVVLGVLLAQAARAFTPERAWELALASGLFFVAYLGGLALVGELRRRDLHTFWQAVHPGRLGGYVRDELGTRPRP